MRRDVVDAADAVVVVAADAVVVVVGTIDREER